MRGDFLVASKPLVQLEQKTLDRLIEMTLPDDSLVQYQRDVYHLKKIKRFNALKSLQYEHECQVYDMFGNLLKSQTPAGEITYC